MIGFPKKYTDISEYAGRRRKGTGSPPDLEPFLKNQIKWHEEKGFPHKKTEGWRHFPFQKILKAGYVLEKFPEEAEKPADSHCPDALVLKVQNGRPILPEKPEGFFALPWGDVLKGKEILPPEIKSFVFSGPSAQKRGPLPP